MPTMKISAYLSVTWRYIFSAALIALITLFLLRCATFSTQRWLRCCI
jgi:hypothetical protein